MKTFITKSWNEYLNRIKDKDIYYYEEYAKLYEYSGEAYAIICEEDENIMLLPFIRGKAGECYDFETPYGYGGPVSNTADEEWNKSALGCMEKHFRDENYLCGFIRFHTLLDNYRVCRNSFDVLFDRNTVAVNLENDIFETQLSSKNRNMIRKAKKQGLYFKAEYDFDSLYEFKELYLDTMKRLKADSFYLFDNEYFDSIKNILNGRGFLGTVRKDGILICAALFMYCGDFGHYHLEGSNYAYKGTGAGNLLLYESALELQRRGVKLLHLGGGTDSDRDNSLFKFKKAFGKEERDFYIGKWIFDKEKYAAVKKEWMENNKDKLQEYGKLLLCYRY